MPKTSQITPNSNGAMPGMATQTIFLSMGSFNEWQECVGSRQLCHSWQKVARPTVSAMILFLSILMALLVWAVVAGLSALRSDGYGDVELTRRNRLPESFPRDR